MTPIRAVAHTNIALVKYWGKNAGEFNLPAVGSLSLTLDRFFTETFVTIAERDSFELDGVKVPEAEKRVWDHVDYFRHYTGNHQKLAIRSRNHVPTASGLASSASAFASLTLALSQIFDLDLDSQTLSRIARRGSGSAARSIFGGFSLMHGGSAICDETAFAEPVESGLVDELAMVVLECARGPKAIGSREAMKRVAETSIFYRAFVENHPNLLTQALAALSRADIEQLGLLMEQSTLQMHATMLGSTEPFWYINDVTLALLNEVKSLRKAGLLAYFTMDAGPHVKVLCLSVEAHALAKKLEHVAGVSNVTVCHAGPWAYAGQQGFLS